MSTYTQILYQLAFSTKNAEMTLTQHNLSKLYKYTWGILKAEKCFVYRIGGTENHIHIISLIHPTISISSLIKDIKISSSIFIKSNDMFPDFIGWQNGYGAFTYSISAKDSLIHYVRNQKEHHRNKSFRDEYKELLNEHKINFEQSLL